MEKKNFYGKSYGLSLTAVENLKLLANEVTTHGQRDFGNKQQNYRYVNLLKTFYSDVRKKVVC